MYQCLKGKRKAEQEPPSVEPITGGQTGVSEATAATPIARVPPSVAATYKTPAVYMLRLSSVQFVQTQRLGAGAFSFVALVKINDPHFPEVHYAAKCMLRGEGLISAQQLAQIEATNINLHHRGIIAPRGLVRDRTRPMVIYRYWNGGTLGQWLEVMKEQVYRPPSSSFRDTAGTVEAVRAHLFHIINGIVHTIEYMHNFDFMHNDLHAYNVLLHFEEEKVYVGIADWGRADYYPSLNHSPALPDDEQTTKDAYRTKFKHLAPECIFRTPPCYSKPQEVYSLSYLVQRLLNALPVQQDRNFARFVSRMQDHVKGGLHNNPNARPDAFNLSLMLNGLSNFVPDITSTSGLRPFDV